MPNPEDPNFYELWEKEKRTREIVFVSMAETLAFRRTNKEWEACDLIKDWFKEEGCEVSIGPNEIEVIETSMARSWTVYYSGIKSE